MYTKRKGFTLVELLVTIAILAVLATVSVVGYVTFIDRANESNLRTEADQVKDLIDSALILDGSTVEITTRVIITKASDGSYKIAEGVTAADHSLVEDLAQIGGFLAFNENGELVYSKYGKNIVLATGEIFDGEIETPEVVYTYLIKAVTKTRSGSAYYLKKTVENGTFLYTDDPREAAQVKLEKGDVDGEYTIVLGDNEYLALTSNDTNKLAIATSKSNNTTWTTSITDPTAKITSKAFPTRSLGLDTDNTKNIRAYAASDDKYVFFGLVDTFLEGVEVKDPAAPESPENPENPENPADAFDTTKEYVIQTVINGTTYYFAGESETSGRFAVTTDVKNAVKVSLEAANGNYYIYFDGKYLQGASDKAAGFKLSAEKADNCIWVLNSDNNTITLNSNEITRGMAMQSTEYMGFYSTQNIDKDGYSWSWLVEAPADAGTGTETPDPDEGNSGENPDPAVPDVLVGKLYTTYNGSNYYVGAFDASGKKASSADENTAKEITLEFSEDKKTVKIKVDGTYIAPKSENDNGLIESEYYWNYELNDGIYTFKSSENGTTLAYNHNQGSPMFRAYKNTSINASYSTEFVFVKSCNHNFVAGETTAPTCTEDGYTTYTCSECNAVEKRDTVEAAHKYVAGTPVDPTCTEKGYTTYTCSKCNASENRDFVDTIDHTAGKAATCTEAQKCTVCDAELSPATDHNLDANGKCQNEGCPYSATVLTGTLSVDGNYFGAFSSNGYFDKTTDNDAAVKLYITLTSDFSADNKATGTIQIDGKFIAPVANKNNLQQTETKYEWVITKVAENTYSFATSDGSYTIKYNESASRFSAYKTSANNYPCEFVLNAESNTPDPDPNPGEGETGGESGGETTPNVVGTFDFGANGAASHKDGSTISNGQNYTSGEYSLNLTGVSNVYGDATDAKGNSCLKLGASSKAGSFAFTVPEDVNEVIIYVAGYKANAGKVDVNGTTYEISELSNNGEYAKITIDTTTNKTITFKTMSGGYRAMINTIEFIK